MSIQFGKCNFDGKPIDPKDLDQVRPLLEPYGPDGEGYLCQDNIGVLYRAFHTTKESRSEAQPLVSATGNVLTWDGRLDNREQLLSALNIRIPANATDLAIVAAAYEHWGTASLPKLLGDWALAIWNPQDRSLTLAKDFVGARHLYYSVETNQVTWCTILDPLLLFAGHPFQLEEEYIAGWLTFFPATHLTPYVGIHAVPPSSFIEITKGKQKVSKYWYFDPAKRIRYRNDAEYEQHFRTVFAESVRRRLRSDSPILAELSGGMDSSSIVCIADDLIARANAEAPELYTLSYYDNSEPNWDERPYFAKVEERRGHVGFHVDVAGHKFFALDSEALSFPTGPFSSGRSEISKKFEQCLTSVHGRVVLIGFGGDEVMGGVPTPVPELADLIANLEFRNLVRQLKRWALQKRKPWVHLFFEALRAFLPHVLLGPAEDRRPAPWLAPHFEERHRDVLSGYPNRLTLSGPPPSFQENLSALAALQRQLGCSVGASDPPYEKRYPYLDRDLLEFIYSIPREQLVRPAQRRSLMRRSLRGIVPSEILNRRRKAYITRAPMAEISQEYERLLKFSEGLLSSFHGIIDSTRFRTALQAARRNQPIPMVTLHRTLALELWLRQAAEHKLLSKWPLGTGASGESEPFAPLASEKNLLAS